MSFLVYVLEVSWYVQEFPSLGFIFCIFMNHSSSVHSKAFTPWRAQIWIFEERTDGYLEAEEDILISDSCEEASSLRELVRPSGFLSVSN